MPEPSLNWQERQKIELQKILDEERAWSKRSRADENVSRLNHKLLHQAVTAIKAPKSKSTSKSTSKAVTKSNKGKNDKENKGKRDKGNKTKEEKV